MGHFTRNRHVCLKKWFLVFLLKNSARAGRSAIKNLLIRITWLTLHAVKERGMTQVHATQ